MGLDIYINKAKRKSKKVEEVCYLGSSVAIENWFCKRIKVQNDVNSKISKEILEDFLKDCKIAWSNRYFDTQLIKDTFPQFDLDDNWSFTCLSEAIDEIEKVVKIVDWEKEDVYFCAWW